MSGSGGSEVRTPIFSGENYEFWRIKMVTIFKSHGLWKLVEKGVTISDSKKKTDEGSAEEYMRDAKALGIIQNAVSDQIFPRIANADTSKMAWDLLYGEYHGGDQVRSVKLQNLRREFEYTRMRDDETLSGYLTRLNELINQMKTFGEVLSNERLVQKVLISLSKPYDPICLVIENTKCIDKVDLQEVLAILKSQEQRFDMHTVDATDKAFGSFSVNPKGQQQRGNSQSSESKKNWNGKGKKWDSKPQSQQRSFANPAQNSTSAGSMKQDAIKPQCKVCSKFHFGECRYKGQSKCHNCDRFGHWARECTAGKVVQKANSASQLEMTGNLFYANSTVTGPRVNGEWYIDSGCSNHMTGNIELLVDVRTNIAGKVQMPTGDLVNVAGMGSLVIDTNKGRKYVREVMYLPGLKENLLSVGQMDEHGYFLVFGGGMCSVYDGPSLESLVMKVKKKVNRCYPLVLLSENQVVLKASVTHCTETWHRRLGHLHFGGLKQLRDKEMVHGLPQLEDYSGVCEGCQFGKQHREEFPRNQAQRATAPLELVHVDLCGPMRNDSIAGNKYFMLLIDDFSRMIWVYFLRYKSDAFNCFRKFKAMTELQSGFKIKCLRRDSIQAPISEVAFKLQPPTSTNISHQHPPTSNSPPNQDNLNQNFLMDENDDLLSSLSLSNPQPRPIQVNENHDLFTLTPNELFPDSSSSSSGDESDAVSLHSTSKRLDYMLQFLDRKLSDDNNKNTNNSNNNGKSSNASQGQGQGHRSSLPEFVAKGGGTGIFKVPVRGAVHPSRPPRLEVRPHPLRETQIGCFLRTMATTESQLWAGTECAVRVWNFKDLYSAAGQGDSGDEETVPFRESVCTSAVICLVKDEGCRVVWSGHRDGRIRCWKMESATPIPANPFKEALSWQAHRGPVLSLVISCYGDLWSGSEGGVIKIWPWEAIEKALSLTTEERHMSSLLVERSYIEPWTQVAVNGFTNILTSDVRYLLSDRSGAKVWSAGYLSFALWDARTRELLKVFSTDGQIENRVDIPSAQDLSVEYVSGSKKDKTQSSFGFFQRSRNAIMGAADAVRRVAVKGAFGDDNRRTEAMVIAVDGMIWTGCTSGLLVQWDRNGNRVQDYHYHSSAVHCFCTFGLRIWVGYASGTVNVLDLEGNLLGGWVAHSSPVIKMAAGAGFIFTLANHGGICGWNITSPGPLDSILRSELAGKEFLYTRIESLKILTGTWNVGQGRASHDSLISWLGSVASTVGVIVVGLQEVEMGAGFLAMSAAKETVGLEGSSVGQWWLDMIGKTLDEGSTFERVGSRQLAGLLIAVWVRNNIRAHVGDVDAAAVPCGFGRAIGNKGAVGLRIRMYGRIMCFVNCHFAAHLEAVNRRNADFDHVYRTMNFCRPNFLNCAAASTSSAVQILRGTHAIGNNSAEGMPELSEADLVIFLGDFNYRLDGISYDEVRDFVSQRCFDWLRERDQLRVEMEAGNVFQGMREADITFPPTYKFERHQAGLAGYDSGEKKRIPAWCDRILYRDSCSASVSECSLECPVVSSISRYEACMDVTDSDHKPVRCIFTVDIARVDESIRRQELGEILKSNEKIKFMAEEICKIPETIVSTNNIILQNQDTSILRITNKCGKKDAFFEIICEGQSIIKEGGHASDHCPRGSFGFPRWLEVTPSAGIIRPDHIVEVSIHHEEHQTLEEFVDGAPQNWWCEDTKDKEVILVVKVRGSYSTDTRHHRVCVRHCCSAKTNQMDPPVHRARQTQGTVLHRSDFQHLSSSCDVVDHLWSLRSP